MKPLSFKLQRIVDFGAVVTLIGFDDQTEAPVAIHIDHRPLEAVRQSWCDAGLPPPVEYVASRLAVNLDIAPIGQGMRPKDKPSDKRGQTSKGHAGRELGR